LSSTEVRIVRLVGAGRTICEVAAAVGIDERAVEWHLTLAARKLERASAGNRSDRRLSGPSGERIVEPVEASGASRRGFRLEPGVASSVDHERSE
jgi:hypothetical protein